MISRLFNELRKTSDIHGEYVNLFREVTLSFIDNHRASILDDHLSALIDELAESLAHFKIQS